MSTVLNKRDIMVPANVVDLNDNASYQSFLTTLEGLAAAGLILLDTQGTIGGAGEYFHIQLAATVANDAAVVTAIATLQTALNALSAGTIYTWVVSATFQ